jgi:autotransporter-associated beta strand protein
MYNPIQPTDTIPTVRISLSPSPWRRRGVSSSLAAAPTLVFLLIAAATVFADSATWNLNPASGDWNIAANWTPATVPNGPADTAQFGVSNTTGVSISDPTEVNGIQFNPGASAFTITAPPTLTLTLSGVGITNNSGATQNFVTTADGAGNHGSINFSNSATAGNATLIANGGTGGAGGLMQFSANSSGGTARVEVFSNGNLDISFHNAPGLTTGSIEGSGAVFLGANKLTMGSNNLTTTFSGVIQDGGIAGGVGGSLTKIGSGKLTLSGANTYTGGTTLSAGSIGTLFVTNRRGSGTGSGPVQVNVGKLAGTGKISGSVTVGTGSGAGAFLTPGVVTATPSTLTIRKRLTFRADGTFHFGFKSSTITADKIIARGVTIDSGALIFFDHVDVGTFPLGTVFTAIDNTSATPIAGTFANLADGGTFTIDNITFQADYQGGDGNDFTLTVVP